MEDLKRCSKCGERHPRTPEYFYRNKSKGDGLSTECKPCNRAHSKKWRKDNPEKQAENSRKWSAANQGRAYANQKTWREANPEKRSEYSRRWRERNPEYSRNRYAANRERVRQQQKEAYAANPEPAKERARQWKIANHDRVLANAKRWRVENPERRRLSHHRRSARKRRVLTQLTISQWEWLKQQSGHCCVYCGRHQDECGRLQQEHVVPLSRGGAHTVNNIRPACADCNYRKHDKTPAEAGMSFAIEINPLKHMKQKSLF